MAAIARLDGADHSQLVLKGARVRNAHTRAEESLRIHALDSDIAPKHLREYPADVMAREAARSNELIGRGGMEFRLGQHQRDDVCDVVKIHHRLAPVQGPGQAENILFEHRHETVRQHVVCRLQDGERHAGGQQILFQVTFDLVLNQIGGDGVKYRTEHEVADARSPRRVHNGEADGPFSGMQGRTDVVEARDAAHGLRNEGVVSEIAHQHLLNALFPEIAGRLFRPHAGAHAMPRLKKLRDKTFALVAVGGSDQDHLLPLQK